MTAQPSEPTQVVVIDGSVLEGGGQILRNTVSLAALLHKQVRIENIRHGRTPPGLKNQHRTGLELAARIASADLVGGTNGSTQIEFKPGRIKLPGQWTADSVTAGATTLLLQIALPMLLFRSSLSTSGDLNERTSLTLLGGTNAEHAPQIDYTQHVFLPFFRNHFLPVPPPHLSSPQGSPSVELEIKKRGYFPKGGGEVEVRIQPLEPGQKLRAIRLVERGKLVAIRGLAHYAGLPKVVGDEMCKGAVELITEKMGSYAPGVKLRLEGGKPSSGQNVNEASGESDEVEVDIKVKREPKELTKGAGSGIVLWAEFENKVVMGGSAVGRKGINPIDVGKNAVEELFKGIEAGGCIEEWAQDQMIIFMALADGKSEVRCGVDDLSLHTKTAIWVAEQLTDAKFDVERGEDGHMLIRCQGIGFTMSG